MRRSVLVVFGAASVVVFAGFPAAAVTTGDTEVTFALAAGELSITVPATADFTGPFDVSAPTVTGNLGTVTAEDDRGDNPADWITSVSSTAFVGSGTAAGTTIPLPNIAYDPGTITPVNITTDGTVVDPLTAVPQPTVVATAGTGVNSATWDPELTITIPPAAAVAGTYTATVTHDVA